MNVGGLEIDYIIGTTYEQQEGDPRPEDEKAKSRTEQRIDLVTKFRRIAAAKTFEQAQPAVNAVVAMAVQMKALDGKEYTKRLANQLREAADFLEDI